MQLKLSENIKRYRKEMGLTQDGLSEALGVTIGAVSKWENGNNVPDITTLMELANLFNISMDELLGYDKSSKNIDSMVENIDSLCDEHRFDEAIIEANCALARYPHTFKILYICAKLYFYKYIEGHDDKDRDTSISLMNRSMEYLSQNTDPDINEYTIRLLIAELYRKKDPERALSELKSINYNGCNNTAIAQILLDTNKREECLSISTATLLQNFASQYQLITNLSMAVASTGKKKDIESAVELTDLALTMLDAYASKDSINYMHKLKTVVLILKAWWLSCLKEYESMEKCVREAYNLAVQYDKNPHASSDIVSSFRFHFSNKKAMAYDTLGASAVAGIESLFTHDKDDANSKNYRHMGKVIDCWNTLKNQHAQ